MKHLGLFEGIGGFSLAARDMGWQTVAWCEINPFCQTVLKYHFPKAIPHDDITKTDFSIYRGKIDIITGGFPCQPFSVAGKQLGTEDNRHLWPEMLRAIREVAPRWVVGENVRGLIGWDGGMVFDQVQADLEAEGYEVFPFLLPACGVNAPHERYRIWFVAHRSDSGIEGLQHRGKDGVYGFEIASDTLGYGHGNGLGEIGCEKRETESQEQREERNKQKRERLRGDIEGIGIEENVADPASDGGIERQSGGSPKQFNQNGKERGINTHTKNPNQQRKRLCKKQQKRKIGRCYPGATRFDNFPTQSPVCGGDDGLPPELDGITFSKWRNESIKAFGNAVVRTLVKQIYRAIKEYEASKI